MNVPLPLQVTNTVGHQLIRQNRLQESMAVFLSLIRRFPKKILGYEGAAKVAMLSGEWAIAEQNWKQVLAQSLNNENALYHLGLTQIELKDYEQAKTTFQKYTEIYPDQFQGYEGMAVLMQKSFQKYEADKWWKMSISRTHSKSSYIKRARMLVRHAQFDEGLDVMDQLLIKHGHESSSLLVKADLLIMAGRNIEAIDLLKGMYKSSPTSRIQQFYAQALVAGKQYDIACEIIEQISIESQHQEMMVKKLKTWQKYHLDGISSEKPKIFGIGLSRTGTTSLTKALEILGFDVLHYYNPITKRVLDLEDFYYFDGFTDSPVSFRFEELYTLFPNAKFIYTERNLVDWVKSSSDLYKPLGFSTTKEMKTWFNQSKSEGGKFDKLFQNYHPTYRLAYESLYADYPTWEDAYYSYEKRVNKFFKNKPEEKLLKINIPEGDGWDKICTFLNVSIPDAPFPHRNKLTSSES
jgi:tetratricopeptide (TPR) repeat protein